MSALFIRGKNGNFERVPAYSGGASSLEDLLPAEVILPETNPMFYDGFLWISQAFTLVDGEEYIVNWNGTEYRCICKPMEYGGMTGLGLGNIGAVTGGANTGEPFVVAALDADSAAYTGFPGLAADLMGATSATVSICEPKKIPDEYLPEKVCYLYGATGTYNYLYNSPDTSNALNRTTAARLRKLVENGTTVWFVSSDSLLDTYVPCHISFNKEFGYGAIMIGIPGLSATNATYFTAEFVGQT